MTDDINQETPDATFGEDIKIRVGNFTCTCGNTIIKADDEQDTIQINCVDPIRFKKGIGVIEDNCIKCSKCGSKWYLVRNNQWKTEKERNEQLKRGKEKYHQWKMLVQEINND